MFRVLVPVLRLCLPFRSRLPAAVRSVTSSATKCVSKNHGYDSTLLGVDESLKKFGFGTLEAMIDSFDIQ